MSDEPIIEKDDRPILYAGRLIHAGAAYRMRSGDVTATCIVSPMLEMEKNFDVDELAKRLLIEAAAGPSR